MSKCADVRMCGCADVRMCGCADVRMCGCADVNIWDVQISKCANENAGNTALGLLISLKLSDMKKDYRRGIVIPILVIGLMIINFTRVQKSEGVRAIHIVILLAIGFALGVLVMNLMTVYQNNKRERGL